MMDIMRLLKVMRSVLLLAPGAGNGLQNLHPTGNPNQDILYMVKKHEVWVKGYA